MGESQFPFICIANLLILDVLPIECVIAVLMFAITLTWFHFVSFGLKSTHFLQSYHFNTKIWNNSIENAKFLWKTYEWIKCWNKKKYREKACQKLIERNGDYQTLSNIKQINLEIVNFIKVVFSHSRVDLVYNQQVCFLSFIHKFWLRFCWRFFSTNATK